MSDPFDSQPASATEAFRSEVQESNGCFGCGPGNEVGLRLEFAIEHSNDSGVTATASVELARCYEGGKGRMHGGIVATLMDEAMSKLSKPLGVVAVTRRLEVDYLRPTPVEQPLTLVGRHVRREGRKLFHVAELRDADGRVLAHANGLFVALEQKPPV